MEFSRSFDVVRAQITALDERSFVLAPSAVVFDRGDCLIQFGLDSTTCGVITVAPLHFLKVLSVFRSCVSPQRYIATRLINAGLDAHATQSLVSELVSYGILRTVQESPTIAVAGTTRAATMLAETLTAAGITVLRPLKAESTMIFLGRMERNVPTMLVDLPHIYPELAIWLRRHNNIIPVSAVDTTVWLGPIRIGGEGACIHCHYLSNTQIDPEWKTTARKFSEVERADVVVDHQLAATASAAALSMVGMKPAAGVSGFPLSPGLMVAINPYEHRVEHTSLQPHHMCPHCHRMDLEKELFKVASIEPRPLSVPAT